MYMYIYIYIYVSIYIHMYVFIFIFIMSIFMHCAPAVYRCAPLEPPAAQPASASCPCQAAPAAA